MLMKEIHTETNEKLNLLTLELLQLETFAAENPEFANSVHFESLKDSEYANNIEELHNQTVNPTNDENFP